MIWALSLLCFSGFALVSFYKGISGQATCGCFGRVPVNPWYTFALDAAAVLALLRWRPRGESRSHVHTFPRFATVSALGLLVGTPVALATWTEPVGTLTDLGELLPDGKTILLKPESWVGKRFPLLEHIDIGDQLVEGEWLVLLYHHDCPKCREAIPRYEALGRDSDPSRSKMKVALDEAPPHAVSGTGPADHIGTCFRGRLRSVRNWFVETPVAVRVGDGVVLEVSSR